MRIAEQRSSLELAPLPQCAACCRSLQAGRHSKARLQARCAASASLADSGPFDFRARAVSRLQEQAARARVRRGALQQRAAGAQPEVISVCARCEAAGRTADRRASAGPSASVCASASVCMRRPHPVIGFAQCTRCPSARPAASGPSGRCARRAPPPRPASAPRPPQSSPRSAARRASAPLCSCAQATRSAAPAQSALHPYGGPGRALATRTRQEGWRRPPAGPRRRRRRRAGPRRAAGGARRCHVLRRCRACRELRQEVLPRLCASAVGPCTLPRRATCGARPLQVATDALLRLRDRFRRHLHHTVPVEVRTWAGCFVLQGRPLWQAFRLTPPLGTEAGSPRLPWKLKLLHARRSIPTADSVWQPDSGRWVG